MFSERDKVLYKERCRLRSRPSRYGAVDLEPRFHVTKSARSKKEAERDGRPREVKHNNIVEEPFEKKPSPLRNVVFTNEPDEQENEVRLVFFLFLFQPDSDLFDIDLCTTTLLFPYSFSPTSIC